MITLQTWRARMSEDMRLRDYRPRTQEGYALAVRLFLDWAGQEPEELTEDTVRAYFLYLRDERQQAPSSINIAVCAPSLVWLVLRRRLASQQQPRHETPPPPPAAPKPARSAQEYRCVHSSPTTAHAFRFPEHRRSALRSLRRPLAILHSAFVQRITVRRTEAPLEKPNRGADRRLDPRLVQPAH